MIRSLAGCLLFTNVLLMTDAQTQVLPRNAAVNTDERVAFDCTSNDIVPQWRYSLNGTGPFTVISHIGNCALISPSAVYSVESRGEGNCNLIVLSATSSEAGVYNCYDGGRQDASAMLTVIETIIVSPTNDSLEPVAYEQLNMTCSVRWTAPSSPAPSMFPSIVWTNLPANINITETVTEQTSTTITSIITVVAIPPTVPSYSCVVYFQEPDNATGHATNAPDYSKVTNTTELHVQYNILTQSSVTLTSYFEPTICEAKILECHPNAYPAPHDVHWFDVLHNQIVNGTNITGEYRGVYECSVSNVINGTNHTAKVTFEIDDRYSFTWDPCKSVSEVTASPYSSSGTCRFDDSSHIYICENVPDAVITCSANGKPFASYRLEGPCQSYSYGQQIKATRSGSYTCIASNYIDDRYFSENATIEIYMPDGSGTCSFPPATSYIYTDDSTVIIILGVFLGISVVINIVFTCVGIMLFLRRRETLKNAGVSVAPTYQESITANTFPAPQTHAPPITYQELLKAEDNSYAINTKDGNAGNH